MTEISIIPVMIAGAGSVLATGGTFLFIMRIQQKQIDDRVSMGLCTERCGVIGKKVDRLQVQQDKTTDKLEAVHVMVERIEAKLNGA